MLAAAPSPGRAPRLEAGLFATVTMGVVVANQRTVATDRIQGFGETLGPC